MEYLYDSTSVGYNEYWGTYQGGGGTGIFHMPLVFFFQQLVDPPFLPNAVCFIRMLCFLVRKNKLYVLSGGL